MRVIQNYLEDKTECKDCTHNGVCAYKKELQEKIKEAAEIKVTPISPIRIKVSCNQYEKSINGNSFNYWNVNK